MGLLRRALDIGGPILIVAAGAFLLQSLPEPVLEFLTGWALISVPAGVVIGHCVLSEDDTTTV